MCSQSYIKLQHSTAGVGVAKQISYMDGMCILVPGRKNMTKRLDKAPIKVTVAKGNGKIVLCFTKYHAMRAYLSLN
jgi:uncharacterized membrane protein YfhO